MRNVSLPFTVPLWKVILLFNDSFPASFISVKFRDADSSIPRPGRKQARKHVRDVRDFNNIETRDVIKFFFPLHGKAPKEIHAILIETLPCFLGGRAKGLSAPLYKRFSLLISDTSDAVAYRGRVWGSSKTTPTPREFRRRPQNRAKINAFVKTVKNY